MKYKTGLKRIEKMLESIEDTDIEEVYFEQGGLNIGIRRKMDREEKPAQKSEVKKEVKKKKPEGKKENVYSNSVGIFRDSLPPSRKILGKQGKKVRKGENIGCIESMNILKEVVSPVDGKIIEKLVKNGDPVEYGQKMFVIKKDV
ncbi:MAG: acetyl-CoA carboxylase biotin carboxyl carrier protein [Elusimicrobiota bacterium]